MWFVFTCAAVAQLSTGSILGTATDKNGAVISNATVTVVNPATGISRVTTSNQDGLYTVPDLPAGSYQVTISAAGFSQEVVNNVNVSVGQEQTINFSLAVGAVSEKITVTDAVQSVDTTSSTIKPVVNERTIVDLPLNGRDWTQLADLQPGVAAARNQPVVSVSNQRANRGVGNQLTIGGGRPQGNNYRVDGISINDYSNGGPGGVIGSNLGVDAIEEFSVVTSNPSADYGKTSGGVVNAVTRSGTNHWHGTAYEFLRNSALDARNEFDSPTSIAPFRRNQYGASVGGPIFTDRTFIFGDYEGLRQFQSINTSSNVPSDAARAGNLVAGPVAVNPAVVPFLNLYPHANGPVAGDVGQFLFAVPTVTHEDYFTIRGDHRISDKDSFTSTYFYDHGTLTAPDPLNIKVTGNRDLRHLISLSETHVFTPYLLNTARFGFSRVVSIAPTTVQVNVPAASDPALGFVPGLAVGLINIGGIANFQGGQGAVGEFDFHYNSYQAYDDVYWTRGKHNIQMGFAFERLQNNQIGTANPNGQFIFGSLAGFLQDRPTSFNAPISSAISPRDLRQSVFGVYVNDDFKILPNLTLNLGLRYEPTTVPTETANRIANLLNLTDATPRLGSPYFNNNTLRNFAPRVGFAWDPFKNGKTAVRAGYGIYDALPLNYLFEGLSIFGAPFFEQGNVAGLAPGTFPTGAFPLLTSNRLRYSFNQTNPSRSYVQQWNFNIQQALPSAFTLQVGYFGSKGTHLPYRVDDVNTVQPTLVNGTYVFPAPVNSGTLLNPAIGQISALFWTGYSHYNSLQAQVNRNLTRHWQLRGSYTWAKSIDDGSSSTFGDTFLNSVSSLPLFAPDRRRALSDFDIRNNLVISSIYDLPKLDRRSLWIASGWQLGGIFQASGGLPITPLIAGDPLGLRSADAFDFPNRNYTGSCAGNPVNTQNPAHYIRLDCFSAPNPLTNLGNSSRNSVIGPGLQDLDMNFTKNNPIARISERFNVQFRADLFNVLNRPNYAPPTKASTQLFSGTGTLLPNSGNLTQTATSSRQAQFALKIIF